MSLGALGTSGGQANGINIHGTIVGTSNGHAFIWTRGGGMHALPQPAGATVATARSINGNGVIVGTASYPNGRSKAVIWVPMQ